MAKKVLEGASLGVFGQRLHRLDKLQRNLRPRQKLILVDDPFDAPCHPSDAADRCIGHSTPLFPPLHSCPSVVHGIGKRLLEFLRSLRDKTRENQYFARVPVSCRSNEVRLNLRPRPSGQGVEPGRARNRNPLGPTSEPCLPRGRKSLPEFRGNECTIPISKVKPTAQVPGLEEIVR